MQKQDGPAVHNIDDLQRVHSIVEEASKRLRSIMPADRVAEVLLEYGVWGLLRGAGYARLLDAVASATSRFVQEGERTGVFDRTSH